jgi:carbonyl reductase 1
MSRIAVVTCANQGLGFTLAESLAQRLAPGDVLYLTGRSDDRVRDAGARIAAPAARVDTHLLDVRNGHAVTAFAAELRDRHGGVGHGAPLVPPRPPPAGRPAPGRS